MTKENIECESKEDCKKNFIEFTKEEKNEDNILEKEEVESIKDLFSNLILENRETKDLVEEIENNFKGLSLTSDIKKEDIYVSIKK